MYSAEVLARPVFRGIIRFDLLLHKAQLYLLTFSQLDRPGANKELALLAAEEATKLANDDHLGHSARGQAYLVTAEALNQLQRFPEATKSAAQACEAAQRNDDKVTLAQGLRLRTMLETSANPDFGNTDLLEQARDLLKESAFDHEGIAVVHDLGSALTRDLLWDQALLALRFRRWDELEAILEDIQQREQDPYWQAALEQYYGEGYTQQGKWQAALPHLERAYMLSRKLENTIGMCAAIGWWGIALYEGGKDDQGIPKLHEAFSLECDILASREGVAKWFLALGREVYQKRGTYELALDSLWRARSLYADLNHILVQQVDQCISQIRAAIGDEQFARLEDAFRPEHGEFAEYYLRSKSNIPLP